jgi:FMN phosphatase YigB (HAD superfamily)
VVFFFDCDNTLLDNDRFRVDLDRQLERNVGADGKTRYWHHYDELREASGYADYLGALQRLRLEREGDPRLAELASFLLDYPFADRLYPGALEAIAHCSRWGTPAILSDGDAVFQPRKLRRSGLWQAVEGRVLIYIHKEKMLDDVTARYPARHFVMIDDKLPILTAMKAVLQDRLTTVWPRQGHYAREAERRTDLPAADLAVERIGELIQIDFATTCPESR